MDIKDPEELCLHNIIDSDRLDEAPFDNRSNISNISDETRMNAIFAKNAEMSGSSSVDEDIFASNSSIKEEQISEQEKPISEQESIFEDSREEVIVPKKKSSSSHREILTDIQHLEEDMAAQKISVTKYDKDRIKIDEQYAIEIREYLNHELDSVAVALGIREMAVKISELVPMIFNGQYSETFKVQKCDMTGYDIEVKRNIYYLRRETATMAKVFRKKLGMVPLTCFNLVRLFGFPMMTVYKKNNSSEKKIIHDRDHDEMDSEEEDF